MNESIRNLEPIRLWNNFADLNAVPRASKKEEQVIEFIKNFGNHLGLETFEDDVRNVIIRKPATPGMENRKGIVLQSHLDMVHQKNNDTVFDFATQGIEMFVDGDWVKARGTTLGADNKGVFPPKPKYGGVQNALGRKTDEMQLTQNNFCQQLCDYKPLCFKECFSGDSRIQ